MLPHTGAGQPTRAFPAPRTRFLFARTLERRASRARSAPRVGSLCRCAAASSADDLAPAGCERVRISLRKPLGLVLEQAKNGCIFVMEVSPTGSAAKDGRIQPGDELISTSALTFSRVEMYGEVKVPMGREKIRVMVRGETLDSIVAAIGTHPASELVILDIQKCAPLTPEQRGLA